MMLQSNEDGKQMKKTDTFVQLKTGLSTTFRCLIATTLFGDWDKVSQW